MEIPIAPLFCTQPGASAIKYGAVLEAVEAVLPRMGAVLPILQDYGRYMLGRTGVLDPGGAITAAVQGAYANMAAGAAGLATALRDPLGAAARAAAGRGLPGGTWAEAQGLLRQAVVLLKAQAEAAEGSDPEWAYTASASEVSIG